MTAKPRIVVRIDPFRITGPAVISFSGGRSSAYMLWRILQAHDGILPRDVLVLFFNTGREMEASLRFVHECGVRWNVRIHWLEYRFLANQHSYEEVGFNSASRNGEPFDQIIMARQFLPNPRAIFCSGELKSRTGRRFVRGEYGWDEWTQAIGLRADWNDHQRVLRLLARRSRETESRNMVFPMNAAGVTKEDVLAFWRKQPFDLMLNGAWEGNCDGCFRKRAAAIARMFRDHPDRMAWWVEKEAAARNVARTPNGALFRAEWKGGYSAIREREFAQSRLNFAVDDDGLDVFAACGTECGI